MRGESASAFHGPHTPLLGGSDSSCYRQSNLPHPLRIHLISRHLTRLRHQEPFTLAPDWRGRVCGEYGIPKNLWRRNAEDVEICRRPFLEHLIQYFDTLLCRRFRKPADTDKVYLRLILLHDAVQLFQRALGVPNRNRQYTRLLHKPLMNTRLRSAL